MGASAREAQPLRLKLFFFTRDADGTADELTRLVDAQVELLRDVPATVGAELVIGVEARLPQRMSACERAGVPHSAEPRAAHRQCTAAPLHRDRRVERSGSLDGEAAQYVRRARSGRGRGQKSGRPVIASPRPTQGLKLNPRTSI